MLDSATIIIDTWIQPYDRLEQGTIQTGTHISKTNITCIQMVIKKYIIIKMFNKRRHHTNAWEHVISNHANLFINKIHSTNTMFWSKYASI